MVVLVGPATKVDPAAFPQRANLHWLGGRDYGELPADAKSFNVCMMPFAMNEATKFINPTKALEYMATGRPIVSTPVQDVVRQFSEVVALANPLFLRQAQPSPTEIREEANKTLRSRAVYSEDGVGSDIARKIHRSTRHLLFSRRTPWPPRPSGNFLRR